MTLSLPTGETDVDWIIHDYLYHMCGITKQLNGYVFLHYAIKLCYEQPSNLEPQNENKLLEEARDIIAAQFKVMDDLKTSQIKRYMKTAINHAWKRWLRIGGGKYPPCPLTINDFLTRSLEALSMEEEKAYWQRKLVLWRYKGD